MIVGHRKGVSAAAAFAILAGFAACAGVEPELPLAEEGHDDAAVEAAPPSAEDLDGGAADGEAHDADAGEPDDAGVRVCTTDWCDTSLPIPDGGKLTLMDVWVASGTDAWAVSEEGLVLRWNGKSWSVAWDAGVPLYGVLGDHQGAIWLVGGGGAIFRGPGGAGWAPIPSGVTTDLVDICEGARDAARVRNLSIVGSGGKVLRWTGDVDEDGAPVWSTSDFGEMEQLYSVACAGFDVWVSGTSMDWITPGGRLYLSAGGDGPWTPRSVQGTGAFDNYSQYETFSSVWAHDQNNVWLRGGIGILRSAPAADGGAPIWSRLRAPLSTNVMRPSDAWGASADDVWIASSTGRIHHWDGSKLEITLTSKGWDVIENDFHAVHGSGPENVWVVGDNIALRRNVLDAGKN
ncbi:MAG: hypothetical protein KF764_25385 [Labilithrix sp.]|nr:hypothetical protein [Labilithrix sp.]